MAENRKSDIEKRLKKLEQKNFELTKSHDALQKKLNLHKALLEKLPQKIFLKDKKSVYISCNESFAKDLNIKPADIFDKTDYDFFPEELAGKFISDDEKILKSGKILEYDEKYILEDSTEYVHTVKSPVKDENGNISGILGVFWLITDRIKAENEQRLYVHFLESLEQVNNVIVNADNLKQMLGDVLEKVLSIYDCDRAWLLYPCDPDSPSFSVPMECTKNEWPGAKIEGKDILHTEDTVRAQREALSSGEPVCYDPKSKNTLPDTSKKFKAKSQMTLAVHPKVDKPWLFGIHQCSHSRIWTDDEKKLFKVIGRRLSDGLSSMLFLESLSESEQYNRMLFEQSSIGLVLCRMNGEIVDVNFAYANMIGRTVEETLRLTCRDITPEKYEQIEKTQLRNLKKTGRYDPYEKEYIHKDGRLIPVRLSGLILKHSENRFILSSVEDLSARKKAELDKKKLEEQLFQAQKMESIGRLAGGIAHDFNNVLTGIMGYAELLRVKFGDVNTPEGEAADVIMKGTERAANLTKQLLGFARGGKYNPVTLQVDNVIKDAVKVTEEIFDKNVKILFEPGKDIYNICADKYQIDQVLTNLLINSNDAMPSGGELILKTENVTIDEGNESRFSKLNPGNYTKISVTDTGTGMTKEVRNRVFEPFFTTKRNERGTGLGLAMVYGIVKNHGGYIYCYSEPGEGTRFSLYFPATDKKVNRFLFAEDVVKGDAVILVVDDEKHVRNLAEKMLNALGYKVIKAENGAEAIKVFKSRNDEIDMVLLDMIMPVMAGKETYLELKKIKPDVRVLLSSGYSRNGKANEILNEGVLGFVQKPYRLREIADAINTVLKY